MDLIPKLVRMERELQTVSNHAISLHARLEELYMRAQRMFRAKKTGRSYRDDEFSSELRLIRKFVRDLIQRTFEIQPRIRTLSRLAAEQHSASQKVEGLALLLKKLKKQLTSLFEDAHMIYQYCVELSDRKEAWSIAKDLEQVAESAASGFTDLPEEPQTL